MMDLRKPLVTLALASSALGLSLGAGLSLGVGLDPADAETHIGTTMTASSSTSPPTSAARSHLAVASVSRNTPDVEDDWTVEWQIMSTTLSSPPSQPAVAQWSGSVEPLRPA
jgi:hypothetical protein